MILDQCRHRASRGEQTYALRQVVVDGIILARQFLKEELRQIADSDLIVDDAPCHLAKLPFDLDHTVQNEMGENHQRVLLYGQVAVAQAEVKPIAILVHDVAEADCDVAKGDHNVASYDWIRRRLEDFEEKHEVSFAEFGANTHELGHGKHGGSSERLILCVYDGEARLSS